MSGTTFGVEFHGPGFAGDMRSVELGDQPVIAAIDPCVESLFSDETNRLACDISGHRLFLKDRKIALNKKPAIEAGDRRLDRQRVKQHRHAARWTAASNGKADPGFLQRFDSA